MDLTVEVMLPPRGAADYATSANPKWRVLAVVAVYPLKTIGEVGMPCTGYVHVTGIPERPAWAQLTTDELMQRINAKLCAVWDEMLMGPAEPTFVMKERRKWAGVAESVPLAARQRLLQDRQITVTWAQFKGVMRHLIEQRSLSDADID